MCDNQITSIDPLPSLSHMQVLYLQGNTLSADSLDGIFTEEGTLVWSDLKIIDVSRNRKMNRTDPLLHLYQLSQDTSLQFGYEYEYVTGDPVGLPHTVDVNGTEVQYVTYEDFGARCDGVYDDFLSMVNAHSYANAYNCEVHGVEGKTYHIFKFYTPAVTVKTSVNWNGATLFIRDEDIEELHTQYVSPFTIPNIVNMVTIDNRDWTIHHHTHTLKPYTRSAFKQIYSVRGFLFTANNLEISHIHHTVTPDTFAGCEQGLFRFHHSYSRNYYCLT